MAETRQLPTLLVYAVDVSLELFDAEHGYLILLTHDNQLDFQVSRHRSGQDMVEPQISHSILNQVIDQKKPFISASAINDMTLSKSESIRAMQLHSVMCVPLIVQNDIIGALYLDNRLEEGIFTAIDLKFLELFANQAATAIQNAMLNSELETRIEKRTAQLQDINQKLQQEINERQKAQQQLIEMMAEQERAKILAQFIRDTSHQFYTPLSIINTNLHMLKKEFPNQSNVQKIETQSKVMTQMIASLVLMTRLENGLGDNVTAINLNQLVRTMATGLSHKIAEKEQKLIVNEADASVIVNGSVEQLLRAVDELLSNASAYTGKGGVITVSIYGNSHAVIEVKDTGSGITLEERAQIFQRFYRGDKVGTTRGLGLGLSIAQKVAENHGGTIEVDSEVNVGSTFRLKLPLSTPTPDA